MDCAVPEMVLKRLFFDVVEGKPLLFTSEEDRLRIQLQMSTTILDGESQLWMLGDLWTQVGILTGKSASTSDFNWS